MNSPEYFPLHVNNYYGLLLNDNADFVSVNPPLSEFNFKQHYKITENKYELNENHKWKGYFMDSDATESSKFNPHNIFERKFDVTQQAQKEFKDGYYFSQQISHWDLPDEKFITLSNPMFPFLKQFELRKPERDYPVEYNFPLHYKGQIILDIPEDYIAEIPDNAGFKLNDKVFYSQVYQQRKGKVLVNYFFALEQIIFTESEYEETKIFIDSVLESAISRIILKKET